MKKTISICTALVLLLGMLALPASAHCGGARKAARQPVPATQTAYEICPVDNCAVLGLHMHDGATYLCAYHDTDGCGAGCYGSAGRHCAQWLRR